MLDRLTMWACRPHAGREERPAAVHDTPHVDVDDPAQVVEDSSRTAAEDPGVVDVMAAPGVDDSGSAAEAGVTHIQDVGRRSTTEGADCRRRLLDGGG
jgi:hypothetical protein